MAIASLVPNAAMMEYGASNSLRTLAAETFARGAAAVNAAVRTSVQPRLLSVIGPLAAPLGTMAVICVSLLIVNCAVTLSANLTAVTPTKFVPVIVTLAPGGAFVGLTPEMVTQGCVKRARINRLLVVWLIGLPASATYERPRDGAMVSCARKSAR